MRGRDIWDRQGQPGPWEGHGVENGAGSAGQGEVGDRHNAHLAGTARCVRREWPGLSQMCGGAGGRSPPVAPLGTGCGGEGVTAGPGRVAPVPGVSPGRRCHRGRGRGDPGGGPGEGVARPRAPRARPAPAGTGTGRGAGGGSVRRGRGGADVTPRARARLPGARSRRPRLRSRPAPSPAPRAQPRASPAPPAPRRAGRAAGAPCRPDRGARTSIPGRGV